MKKIFTLLSIALAAYLIELWMPWWGIAITCFLIGLVVPQRVGEAFVVGFIAIFCFWGGYAFIIDQQNEAILSTRVAQIFQLLSPVLLILVTAFIGGLTGGASTMTGVLLRQLINPLATQQRK